MTQGVQLRRSLQVCTVVVVAGLAGSVVARAQVKPLPGSPAARRLARSHKVFLGMANVLGPPEVTQHFYDELAVDLRKNNGYDLVDEAKQAEVVLTFYTADDTAYLSLADPETHAIAWTVSAPHSAFRGTLWSGNEAKYAQKLSDALKELATATP